MPLSEWMCAFEKDYAHHGRTIAFDNAIAQLGTNSIPILLQQLRQNTPVRDEIRDGLGNLGLKGKHVRSHLRNHLGARGFFILGSAAGNAVPALTNIIDDNISEYSRGAAAEALAGIGPPAQRAIPSLLLILQYREQPYAKMWACYALGKIHQVPSQVVPVLGAVAIGDEPMSIRLAAISAIGQFGSDAQIAEPALTKCLDNESKAVARAAEQTLKGIGVTAPLGYATSHE